MGLALLDRELKFVRINEALAEMNGLPVEAHIGRTAWDIVPELRPSAEPALTKVLTSGEPALDVVVTGTTAAKPDVVREWREQFYPLKNTSGEVIGVGIVCDEVTERRALERRLRESEAHLRRVIDQLFAFVGTLTPDGVLTEANQAPIEAGGISREDVIGKPFADAPWWSYDAQVQARLREDIAAAAAGATIRYDVPVAMAADSRVTIDFQLAPLRDDGGNITHLIASGVVVDDRIAAEAELRALNETLERRVREEASRREAAQQALLQAQKLEALGQLTSGIAHDFNNVIQAISAGFALIMKRTRDPQIIHIAEHSVKAAERGSSIVKQLLSFARQRPLEISRIDLCALLNEAKPLLERSAGAKAKFTLDCPDDIGTVETDPGLLEAALINLVVNARDAICDHGCISVRVSRAVSDTGASHVTIAVEDNGSGMSPEVVARARDPFLRPRRKAMAPGLALPWFMALRSSITALYGSKAKWERGR
jgi:PAS domain S-box-containing protein